MHSLGVQATKPRDTQLGEHATTAVSEPNPAGVV